MDSTPAQTVLTPQSSALSAQLQQLTLHCTQCRRCVKKCLFLQQQGDPKQLAATYPADPDGTAALAFKCSLCHLCQAICPEQLDPASLFLELRREQVSSGTALLTRYRKLLNYEQRGTSRRFSWYALPSGCVTIFFPGCSLPGSRPQQTLQSFALLQQQLPGLGIVLDCCSKPAHDLGRQDYFLAMFGEMKRYLLDNGVKQVLVACPNCYQVFQRYGAEFTVTSIYEILADGNLPETPACSATVNVHDPCVARFAKPMQTAVRRLAERKGLQLVETLHSRSTTLCCGEGGAVGCLAPELASSWTQKNCQKISASRTVTYCAGCASTLDKKTPTSHILDLLFTPQAALEGSAAVSGPALSYWNRLRLKKQLQTSFNAPTTRERCYSAAGNSQPRRQKKLLLIAALLVTVALLRLSL